MGELKYSEQQACRRISAMRLLKIKETMDIINEPKKDIITETIRIHVNISESTHEKLQKVKGLLKEEDFDKLHNVKKSTFCRRL